MLQSSTCTETMYKYREPMSRTYRFEFSGPPADLRVRRNELIGMFDI